MRLKLTITCVLRDLNLQNINRVHGQLTAIREEMKFIVQGPGDYNLPYP